VFTGVRALQGLVDDAVITELSVRLTDDQFQPQVLRSLTDVFAGLDVKTWQEMDPMAAAVFLFADAAIFLYFLIVMTALVFGLVNTLVTSVMERVREMGMLRAVGMRPGAVIAQVVLESTFIMAIGVVIGLAFGFGVYQLLPPEIDLSRWGEGFEAFNIPVKLHLRLYASDMLLVAILSLVFGVLASLYPAKKAVKLSPVEALRR
jgi:ABC-type lipoprotein release transport system permease subunit